METVYSSFPSLSQLCHKANDLHNAYQALEPAALDRFREDHSAFAKSTDENLVKAQLTLGDAQLVIAREHNFDSWALLKEYFEWDLAVHAQNIEQIKLRLIEKPERARQPVRSFRRDGSFFTPSPLDCSNNNIPMLLLLLEFGAGEDIATKAVLRPDSTPEYIDFALEHGANLETPFYNGTVLSIAAYSGQLKSVRHYIRRGANVNAPSLTPDAKPGDHYNTGETPLHRATFCKMSLRGPIDEDVYNKAFNGIVRALIEAGADVNAQTNRNAPSDMGPGVIAQEETPLHLAAMCGDEEMITLLLDAGADKTILNAIRQTPFHFARLHNRSESILSLLR